MNADFIIFYVFLPVFAFSFASAMAWLLCVSSLVQHLVDRHDDVYKHLGSPVIHVLFWSFPKERKVSARVRASATSFTLRNEYTFTEIKSMTHYVSFIFKAGYRSIDDPTLIKKGDRARIVGICSASSFTSLFLIALVIGIVG